jgi:DNA cross-link repair 1B protein
MFIFKGKMGTVFHTGDFRFTESLLRNTALFPADRANKEQKAISLDVDYLFLDNTFANPKYDFPTREIAYQELTKIIRDHEDYRVYLFSYNLGKEEVFINLAQDFDTMVTFKNHAIFSDSD